MNLCCMINPEAACLKCDWKVCLGCWGKLGSKYWMVVDAHNYMTKECVLSRDAAEDRDFIFLECI